jgi:hypothetical protein
MIKKGVCCCGIPLSLLPTLVRHHLLAIDDVRALWQALKVVAEMGQVCAVMV